MGKIINYEVFRCNNRVFIITEYEKCFMVRVAGEYEEYQLDSQADVSEFVQYYGI